jgi:hypothetical protein
MTNEKRTGDTSRKENYVLSCAGRSAKNKVRNQMWEISKLEAGECIIPKFTRIRHPRPSQDCIITSLYGPIDGVEQGRGKAFSSLH